MQYIENGTRDMESLLKEVQGISAMREDFIAPTHELQVRTAVIDKGENKTEVILEGSGGEPTRIFEANDVAFDQIAQKNNVPTQHAHRLRDFYPDLFDLEMNRMHAEQPRKAMLRTYDRGNNRGVLRAVVSDKFKTFDHPDLLESVLPTLIDSEAQWQIVNYAVTDRRLYARFKSLAIRGENPAAVGDFMAQGLVVSNSETGHGSVSISQLIWTLACLNGMQTANRNRTAHLTSSRSDSETWSILSDESKSLDNRALSAKLRDITASYASRSMFESVLQDFARASEDLVEGGLAAAQPAVQALGTVLKLSKAETSSVLDGLMDTIQQEGYRGQPLSRATLVNAVTAVGHKAEPDMVSEWQSRGGRVLDMAANNWASIAAVPVAAAA